MCNCKEEFQNEARGVKTSKGVISGANFRDTYINLETTPATLATYSNMEVYFEGKKKPHLMPLLHKFCPFCGVKYKIKED